LDAVANALQQLVGKEFNVLEYNEHAMTGTSKSQAVAYVCVSNGDNKPVWGVGIHNDIITASISALTSAINKMI
ncbi:MAG: alpha-isopropylmalate synthase regulatory domain-containing protein, partial [Clostridia bacterium]